MNTKSISLVFTILLAYFAGSVNGQEPNSILLHSHTRRSSVNYEWWLPLSKINQLPNWKSDGTNVDEPPLSPGAAVRIARKWAVSKGAPKNARLQRFYIKLLDWEGTLLPYKCCYIISFEAGLLDTIDCVVLMDGSTVEPRRATEKRESPDNDRDHAAPPGKAQPAK